MFEVGSLAGLANKPVARGGGNSDRLDLDELLAVQNKVLQARTVCSIKSEMKEKLDIDVVEISVNGPEDGNAPGTIITVANDTLVI